MAQLVFTLTPPTGLWVHKISPSPGAVPPSYTAAILPAEVVDIIRPASSPAPSDNGRLSKVPAVEVKGRFQSSTPVSGLMACNIANMLATYKWLTCPMGVSPTAGFPSKELKSAAQSRFPVTVLIRHNVFWELPLDLLVAQKIAFLLISKVKFSQ